MQKGLYKTILVEGFCPLKTEIARFPIGFRLNFSHLKEINGKTKKPVRTKESTNEKKEEPERKPKLTICNSTWFFIYKFFQSVDVFFPAVKLLCVNKQYWLL